MPRPERRRPARRERSWNPWWLALPALALAAWAAFAATLSLLGDDGSRAPSATARDADVPPPPAAAVAPAAPADGVVAPAAAPAAGATADEDVAASAAPGVVPAPSATPAAQRAAVDKPRKVKPKRAPQEHLTEQDRRALDALVEQADERAR